MNLRWGYFCLVVWCAVVYEGLSQETDIPITKLQSVTKVSGELPTADSRRFPLDLARGDYVRGRLEGRHLRLTLMTSSGQAERALVTTDQATHEFQFVIGEHGPYALELRSISGGAFTLSVDSIVSRAEQYAPAVILESLRLRQLQQTVATGGDTEMFWNEVRQNRGPLIERDGVLPPVAEGLALVTFVWRGAKHNVKLFGAPSNDHDDLNHLAGTDVWFGSYRVPETARVSYKYAPDVPELDASPMIRRRAILATAQRDPFNPVSFPAHDLPDRFAGESLLELPLAAPQPWLEPRPHVPSGTCERHSVTSAILRNTRDVFVYRPHGYCPESDDNRLLVIFDGDRYKDDMGVPIVLDNLIAAGIIPSTAAVFITNPSSESRSTELPCHPEFSRFLAEELMPWVQQQRLSVPPKHTVVVGASYGGLAAAYAGWTHPEIFGNVYSQSGSFWWSPQSADPSESEPEWLTRQFATTPRRPVRFYLEAGQFEIKHEILPTTRHLRDVLRAKGYEVDYGEFTGGHGYVYWRYSFPTGLVALLKNSQSAIPSEKTSR
ncbi:DUF3327 domain-containing protein [bacterium]|nr:DUF3327 domain-containing protein [bacterium]